MSTLQELAGLGTGADDAAPTDDTTDEAAPSYSPRARDRLSLMLKELRKERAGPSNSEKWLSIASALATPVARGQGRFGQVLGNVTQSILTYEGAKRAAEKENAALAAKYELGLADLEDKAALAKAAASAKAQAYPLTTDEARFRMGIARQLYPNKTQQEIKDENLMYAPDVNREALSYIGMRSAAVAGEPVAAVAPRVPTLEQFMAAARASPKNAGVSDDQIQAYYYKTYEGR